MTMSTYPLEGSVMSEALVHAPATPAEYPSDTTLEVLEAVVENTIGIARQALLTIKERRLYKPRYATWELYCVERWGKSRTAIWRQLEQAKAERALPAGTPVPSQRALAREKGTEAAALKTLRAPPESPGDSSVPRNILASSLPVATITEAPSQPELAAQAHDGRAPLTPGERVWGLWCEAVWAGASAEDVVAAAMAAQVGVEDRRSSAAGMWRLVAALVKAVGRSLAPTDEPEMVLGGVAYRQVKGTIRWEPVPQDETVIAPPAKSSS